MKNPEGQRDCGCSNDMFCACDDKFLREQNELNRPLTLKSVCSHPLAIRPIFYTDSIGGKQVMRDDLWAVTTDELNGLLLSATGR